MQRIGGLLERHVFLGQPDRALAEAREAARLIPSPWSYDNWVLLAILADRLVEAQSALAEADNKGFDTSRLRWNRDLVAFVRHDKAGLQEQWIRVPRGLVFARSELTCTDLRSVTQCEFRFVLVLREGSQRKAESGHEHQGTELQGLHQFLLQGNGGWPFDTPHHPIVIL